jgi:hypothetical protein
MKKLQIILLALVFTLSSCATIFTGSKQNVQINSIPSGAKVSVDGMERGVTPLSTKLKKGFEGQTITLKMDGYQTKVFQPETTFNAVAVLNMFGLLGWAIDAATGAMMKYSPKSYEITLDKN